MAASGGAISLRLSLAGSEQVKAALASLGPAGRNALRQIEAAAQGPTSAMKALSAAGQQTGAALQGLAGRAGAVGNVLSSIGPAGLVAAAGIGALVAGGAALFAQMTKAADWAEDITKFSKAIGASTTEVQEWDFVAQAANIPIASMRSSLQGLAETIGKVQDNLVRGKAGAQVKVFEAIFGENAEDAKKSLREMGGDLDKILPKILDYAAKLEPTARAGFAQALKMDPETLNSLVDARDKIAGLIDEAHRFGIIVPTDVVAKANDAAGAMHVAATVANDELRVAFVDLAGGSHGAAQRLVEVAVAIGDIARGAANAIGAIANLASYLGRLIPDLGAVKSFLDQYGYVLPGVGGIIGLAQSGAAIRNREGVAETMAPGSGAKIVNKDSTSYKKSLDGVQPFTPDAPSRGGRRKKGPKDKSEEIAAESERTIEEADQEIADAKKDELQRQLAITKDADQRVAIQTQIADLEEQARQDQIDQKKRDAEKAFADKKITKAALDQAEAAAAIATTENKRRRDLEVQAAMEAEAKTKRELARQIEDDALTAQLALLKAEQPLAVTMAERRDLAMEIFDLEEQIEEAKLSQQASDDKLSEAERRRAADALASLQATRGARQTAVSNQNLSPWQQWAQDAQKATSDVNGEFQQVAVDGLNKFNQGLIDSQGRLTNMRDLFRSVITDMITQLEQYLLKQAEIGLFSQLGLGGGGGGGGGGGIPFLSMLLGHADGGWVRGYAGGGWVSGPGGPRGDKIVGLLSDGEHVTNARAAREWGPVLEAINSGALSPRRFADGGVVGTLRGGPSNFGGVAVHNHYDMSIHAPGADAAALQRVSDNQEAMRREFSANWVNHAKAAIRQGMIAGGRQPVTH